MTTDLTTIHIRGRHSNALSMSLDAAQLEQLTDACIACWASPFEHGDVERAVRKKRQELAWINSLSDAMAQTIYRETACCLIETVLWFMADRRLFYKLTQHGSERAMELILGDLENNFARLDPATMSRTRLAEYLELLSDLDRYRLEGREDLTEKDHVVPEWTFDRPFVPAGDRLLLAPGVARTDVATLSLTDICVILLEIAASDVDSAAPKAFEVIRDIPATLAFWLENDDYLRKEIVEPNDRMRWLGDEVRDPSNVTRPLLRFSKRMGCMKLLQEKLDCLHPHELVEAAAVINQAVDHKDNGDAMRQLLRDTADLMNRIIPHINMLRDAFGPPRGDSIGGDCQ